MKIKPKLTLLLGRSSLSAKKLYGHSHFIITNSTHCASASAGAITQGIPISFKSLTLSLMWHSSSLKARRRKRSISSSSASLSSRARRRSSTKGHFFKLVRSRHIFSLYFTTVNSKCVHYKILPMAGFEPWTSIIGSDHSANWVTNTSNKRKLKIASFCIATKVY